MKTWKLAVFSKINIKYNYNLILYLIRNLKMFIISKCQEFGELYE